MRIDNDMTCSSANCDNPALEDSLWCKECNDLLDNVSEGIDNDD